MECGPDESGPLSHWAAASKTLFVYDVYGNSYPISIMQATPNELPKLIRGFRFLGWVFIVFGIVGLIDSVRALMNPAATVNFNHVVTSDPHTKLMATMTVALFPIVGLLLVSCPRRFFEHMYARAKAEREKLLGSHRKR